MASFCGFLFLAFTSFLIFNFYYTLLGGSYFNRVRHCTQHNIVVCIINPGNNVNNGTSIADISNVTLNASDFTTETSSVEVTVTLDDEKLSNSSEELKIVPDANIANMTLLKKLIEKIYPRFAKGQATQTTLLVEQQTTSNLDID